MQRIFGKLFFYQLFALHAVNGAVNFSRIIQLSDQIRRTDEIRSLVVFSQKSFVANLREYEDLLRHESAINPLVLIGDDYQENRMLGHLLGRWAFILVFMANIENHQMFSIINDTLSLIHSSKMLIVLETAPQDYQSFEEFFKGCFRLGIVNIIIMFDDEVLSYEPFPQVRLENMTSTAMAEYYPDRSYDLKGYVFYTPICQDGSRVFIYFDQDGNEKITGVNAEIFRSFVRRHNATFQRVLDGSNHSGFDILGALRLMAQGKVDILMHTYPSYNPIKFAFSYPISQIKWLLVCPFVGEIPAYQYLILPFDNDVWLWLGVTFVYITLASYMTRDYCQNLREFGPAFTRSLAELLYLSSTGLPFNLRALVFEMPIFCYGLILTNLYSAFLSAFLTTTVQGEQIETFEQLLQSGVKIISTNYETMQITSTRGFDKRYNGVFEDQNIDFMNEYRKSLNGTYAFVFGEDRANFFLGQQKYLEKKRMHVSKNTMGTYFLTFIMQKDSPFRKNFDGILLQLYETGLYKKWEGDVFNRAVATKYLQLFRTESDMFRALTIDHLGVAWFALAAGFGLSAAVFAVEILRLKMKKNNRLRKLKCKRFWF